MSEKQYDIEAQNAEILRQMDEDIEKAYNNLVEVSIEQDEDGQYSITEQNEAMNTQAQQLKKYKLGDIITVQGDSPENSALTSNSHLYHTLVKKGFLKLKESASNYKDVSLEDIDRYTENVLGHEYEHSVPGLGMEEETDEGEQLSMQYGISFVKDAENGMVGLQPFVRMDGKVKYMTYLDIVTNPSQLSPGDKARLDEH